jgi:hypothetical protein
MTHLTQEQRPIFLLAFILLFIILTPFLEDVPGGELILVVNMYLTLVAATEPIPRTGPRLHHNLALQQPGAKWKSRWNLGNFSQTVKLGSKRRVDCLWKIA